LKGATESFPFDTFSLVLKVQGKMFALIPLNNYETQIALKCDPERAIALREEFSAITPAWHFNKKHWNTVTINPSISRNFLCELINHSYNLVVAGLPRKLQLELQLSTKQH
jgi:predicted DNA-binding protein (MmcQ/YjbR family)